MQLQVNGRENRPTPTFVDGEVIWKEATPVVIKQMHKSHHKTTHKNTFSHDTITTEFWLHSKILKQTELLELFENRQSGDCVQDSHSDTPDTRLLGAKFSENQIKVKGQTESSKQKTAYYGKPHSNWKVTRSHTAKHHQLKVLLRRNRPAVWFGVGATNLKENFIPNPPHIIFFNIEHHSWPSLSRATPCISFLGSMVWCNSPSCILTASCWSVEFCSLFQHARAHIGTTARRQTFIHSE